MARIIVGMALVLLYLAGIWIYWRAGRTSQNQSRLHWIARISAAMPASLALAIMVPFLVLRRWIKGDRLNHDEYDGYGN